MPKITVEEQKDFSVLPPDSILHLKVDELEVRDVDGKFGPWQKLEFTFKILGIQVIGDGSPVEEYEDLIASKIWGSVPFKITESDENQLRQWAEAILGIEMGLGFELDTDDLLGRECRGVTGQYTRKKVNKQAHQIESLLPKANQPGAARPQQAQAQNPWGTPAQPSPAASAANPFAGSSTSAQPAWDDEPPF